MTDFCDGLFASLCVAFATVSSLFSSFRPCLRLPPVYRDLRLSVQDRRTTRSRYDPEHRVIVNTSFDCHPCLCARRKKSTNHLPLSGAERLPTRLCCPIMSYCKVIGFFKLEGGFRLLPTSSLPSSSPTPPLLFPHYFSTISSFQRHLAFASIRAPRPLNSTVIHGNTFVFLIGHIFIQTRRRHCLIDAIHMHVVPPNTTSCECAPNLPCFPASYIRGLGSVCGQAQILPDGSKTFPVSVSQVVRDSVKHFKVVFVKLSLLFVAIRLTSRLAVCSPPSIRFRTATCFLKLAVTSSSTARVPTFSLPACWLSLSIISVSILRSNRFVPSSLTAKMTMTRHAR